MSRDAPFSRLYPILDASRRSLDTLAGSIRALGAAGLRLVQLRAKELGARDYLRWAETAAAAAREAGVALIVNDRVDVALLSEASGVHVGQDDISAESARRLLGRDRIVGLSTHSVEEARAAESAPVDYVAIGPVFATATKPSETSPLGLDFLREVRPVVTKPLVAIGGITLKNAGEVIAAGADGVAVISALRGEGKALEGEAKQWLARLSGGESGNE